MKKRIVLLLLCLLLTGCTQAYDGPTQEARVLLRQEFITYHNHMEGFVDMEPTVYVFEYGYDLLGNRVLTRNYRDGKAKWLKKATFDEEGREIRVRGSDYWLGIPIPTSWDNTTYDDQGRILTWTRKNPAFWENSTHTHTYTDGVETEVWTDWQGNVTHSQQTHFDDRGRVEKYVYPDYEYRCYYDEAGNQVREEQVEDGIVTYWEERVYDSRNRLTQRTYLHGSDVKTLRWSYDDSAGTATILRENGSYEVEHYNEFGEMYFSATYDPDGTIISETNNTYGPIQVPRKEENP